MKSALVLALMLSACTALVHAQAGRGGRGGPPPTAKTSAPIDLTGYWTAVITEDWHVRMLTAPKGDFGVGAPGAVVIPGRGAGVGLGPNPGEEGSIPYKTVGSLAALKWDPAKDEAEGNACKAYGAAGIMRLPTHLHITWQDDNTLKMDADFGTQTRVIHFVPPAREGKINFQSGDYVPGESPKLEPPPGIEPSWQGYSAATWIAMGGRGNFERGGSLKVVTSRLKPGYYWKNGMPYTADAVLTEHFRTLDLPDGSTWIILVQVVDDPEYLTQPFVVNYHFKKLPDGSKWKPTPCSAK
jgi:ABC-type transport system substrate-binding protein